MLKEGGELGQINGVNDMKDEMKGEGGLSYDNVYNGWGMLVVMDVG